MEYTIMTDQNQNNRIIRVPEMVKRSGVSRLTLDRWEKVGKFPKRRKLGSWLVGWLESDFLEWLNDGGSK
ncbi:helix-turn-helix transcriptional regulator [Thiothrix winogradskyi]|uniref:AlpA family phage regulatory protein n=1 Tax=Thiothrix winogradskyi TaxID=96472 RepID=A0ABY3SZ24_9GAMM|nr:AlpA family phage regulatory protein [Thiothrix winogradskyi]UJS24802.1 AlpA family phage regulatory protein [Thiothrix winogradskyi]